MQEETNTAAIAESNIRSGGEFLAILAKLGMLASGAFTVWLACLPWLAVAVPSQAVLAVFGGQDYALFVVHSAGHPPVTRIMVSLGGLALGLMWYLPAWALYRLGRCFGSGNALNLNTSIALRQLGHALLISTVVLPILAGIFIVIATSLAGIQPPDPDVGVPLLPAFLSLGATLYHTVLLPLIASFCLYALAWLIQVGAEAADDSRSIV